MSKILGISSVLTWAAAVLPAQFGGVTVYRSAPVEVQQFQQAGTIGTQTRVVVADRVSGGSQFVTAHPFSGTEERKSVQTLADGTEISSSSSDVYTRDSQGRTRVEETNDGITRVTIDDPVGHFSITLNSETKTARKTSSPTVHQETLAELQALLKQRAERVEAASASVAVAGGARGGRRPSNTVTEDLGTQSINGVLATGTRSTLTIPKGQIGNNRDIHVVNERWYSNDLQMLVKTVNSDPRFGESTYELTNVSFDEPDPTLFQIPADYKVVEAGGRGGAAPATVINK